MATTTNLILALPPRGGSTGVWDTPVNDNSGVVDACFGSVTSLSVSSATTFSLSTSQSQVNTIRISGTITGNVFITLGAIIKEWTIDNNTINPGFILRFTGSSGSGNTIMPPPGTSRIRWDGSNMSFVNLGRIGEYWDYAGSAIPAWISACTVPPALHCNGGTFSAVTYPVLANLLGTTTIPDLRGRSRFALDGGVGRVTTAGSGIDGATLFAAGGSQNVTLVTANLPAYTPAGTISNNFTLNAQTKFSFAVAAGGNPATIPSGASSDPVSVTGSITSTFTGTAQGGTSTAVQSMNPAMAAGITMMWAV